jgi:hypothetical protein
MLHVGRIQTYRYRLQLTGNQYRVQRLYALSFTPTTGEPGGEERVGPARRGKLIGPMHAICVDMRCGADGASQRVWRWRNAMIARPASHMNNRGGGKDCTRSWWWRLECTHAPRLWVHRSSRSELRPKSKYQLAHAMPSSWPSPLMPSLKIHAPTAHSSGPSDLAYAVQTPCDHAQSLRALCAVKLSASACIPRQIQRGQWQDLRRHRSIMSLPELPQSQCQASTRRAAQPACAFTQLPFALLLPRCGPRRPAGARKLSSCEVQIRVGSIRRQFCSFRFPGVVGRRAIVRHALITPFLLLVVVVPRPVIVAGATVVLAITEQS